MPQYEQSWVINRPSGGGASFGQSLSVTNDGGIVVVGDPSAKRAHVFIGGTYKLLSQSGSPYYYGQAVSISPDGSTVVVGAPDFGGEGKAYVYKAPSWNLHATLASPAGPENGFGYSVAASDGGHVAVSTQTDYIYVFSGSSYGTHVSLEVPVNTAIMPIRMSGDGSVLVANPNAAAYVFHGSSWGTRTELSPPLGLSGYFAESVAISEDGTAVLVAGQANYSYIFSGSGWDTVTSIPQPVAFEGGYGVSCAIDGAGQIAVIGAPESDEGGDRAGKAYAFDAPDDYTSAIADAPRPSELLGVSMALSGDGGTLVMGGVSARVVVFSTDIGGDGWGLLL